MFSSDTLTIKYHNTNRYNNMVQTDRQQDSPIFRDYTYTAN